MICDNLSVNEKDHLCLGGQDTVLLAEQYGTPLYLLDEDRIRLQCRTYLRAMREAFGEAALPLYASKAASFKQIYRIMQEEGMGIDVVSVGEICTAHAVGFPLERAYFHSNNKTDADILYAMERGVGYFVVDNREELDAIERVASEKGSVQKILLRLTPGIDPHTYEAVSTGNVDSKFGSAIETGQAEEITTYALTLPHLHLAGFHCHVGSQVFDADVFLRSAEIMLRFMAEMRDKHGYLAEELDLGGGFGVRYLAEDPVMNIADTVKTVGESVQALCRQLGLPLPAIRMEPGRSIVAEAGMTLYTVGTVKQIPGYKNYVSVDGGMTDNPRFALYRSPYTVLLANRTEAADAEEQMRCSVVGRCCESGDILQENVKMPKTVARGDLLAVLTTGAYNYSMSSNYNRIPRPPVVMLAGGESYLAVKRETPEDVCRNDL
ncbi:MAG: diaminopimelate decarboxylase [Clostridia bacterium]|nr:diaminopimelate decarboxylase [Clostridia bacterium]MBQ5772496.1 diaminopimelate decarboxylase [Clostridia bacterium]